MHESLKRDNKKENNERKKCIIKGKNYKIFFVAVYIFFFVDVAVYFKI